MKAHKKENAQGMVEFALILPILLLVIVGIMEMGRLLFFYQSVTSASREGARYASAVGEVGGVPRYADCPGIRDAALKAGSFAGLEDGEDGGIGILYDDGNDPYLDDCDNPPSDGINLNLADRVVVTASGTFRPVVPLIDVFFPEGGLDVSSVTARTVIKDVRIPGDLRLTYTPEPTPTPVCPPTSVDASTENQTLKISIPNPDTDYVYHLKMIDIDFPITPTLETITFSPPHTVTFILEPLDKSPYHIEPGIGDTFIWHGMFYNPQIMEFTFDTPFVPGDLYHIQVLFSGCDWVTSNYPDP